MRLSTNRPLKGAGNRGLQKFGGLLLDQLANFGVKYVDAKAKSDIHLIIISGQPKSGAKNVLRLDGVYYDVGRLKSNGPIKRSIATSDGVVYQSRWCKIFVEGMLQTQAKRYAVIHNGTKSIPKDIPQDKYGFDKLWISCANWRINKRLKSMVHAFIEAVNRTAINAGFAIIGKADYVFRHPRIKYLGHQTDLRSIYRSADYMCHICHLDACPNSVVEGLYAGIPVLCNNIGGTPEIVGDSGIILPLDCPFDFKPIKNMEKVGPSSVDHEILTQGMIDMMSRDWSINRPDLSIESSARKYYDFFLELLNAGS